jgi:integrase/recombinase XerD
MSVTPLITIFVRHSADCKYHGDEFEKRCKCRKHMRWSMGGKQHRKQAGTRSWVEAEEVKRELGDQLAGRKPEPGTGSELLLSKAIETFNANKEAQGIKPRVRAMYARELKRLQVYSEAQGLYTVRQALNIDNLTGLRGTWAKVYPSSWSRLVVQKHLNHFLKFAYNSEWIDRQPKLSPIKVDEPETEPLTDAEYKTLLEHAEGKTAVLIQLMRWSGLAIRDASTLKRTDLVESDGTYRIIRKRTKTKANMYIPIPPDVAKEVLRVLNGNPVYVFWNKQSATSSEYRQAGYMGEQVKKAFDAAGIESSGHMISHRLRSTFAVDLLRKGVPLEHVSKLLGHTSVTTTERHYARWIKGRQDLLDSVVSASWTKR